VIATATGSFSAGNAAVTALVNPGNAWGSNTDVMNYLRGDRSLEGSTFRVRRSLMGAPINAEPAVDRTTGVVYAATGEGMLHAIDIQGADAGKELWAFVPRPVLSQIGQTTSRSYAFRPRLDGTPVVRGIGGGNRLLVAGMGPAGRGYYALDVSSPRGLTEAALAGKVKWEFPSASDATMQAKVGQTVGRPLIVRVNGGGYAVVLTSGYNNTHDGKGRLWVLDAGNGSVLKEFATPDGTLSAEAGLAHVSAFAEPDGSVRYVYGGDLLGNVWRFDLTQASGSTTAVFKVAQLKGPSGAAQPVTAAPELLSHAGKRIVYIGSGRLLDSSDFGSTQVQTIYAIADGPTLANPRPSLVQQVLNVSGSGTLTSNPVDWAVHRGWYVDLPAGEQVNTQPVIAYGALSVVANKAGASDCSASSRLYVMDVLSGSRFAGISFVSWTISDTSNASAPIALLGRDGKVRVVALKHEGAQAQSREVAGSGLVPAGKNAWREVRR
jgi:type IV pilus assembly protein PilY1